MSTRAETAPTRQLKLPFWHERRIPDDWPPEAREVAVIQRSIGTHNQKGLGQEPPGELVTRRNLPVILGAFDALRNGQN